jgi:hypothetical protein
MDNFIYDLKLYIFLTHKTQSNYAKHVGVSNAYVSAIVRGQKPPNKLILDSVGYKLEKLIVKK